MHSQLFYEKTHEKLMDNITLNSYTPFAGGWMDVRVW